MKTLYISDLDGTLLRGDGSLSKFTASAVNSLIREGMIFSYATARSYVSAKRVTEGLSEEIPVIIFNGTFVLDGSSGEMLSANFFTRDETEEIVKTLTYGEVWPFVHYMDEKTERFTYIEDKLSRGASAFVEERRDDPRRLTSLDADGLKAENAFHFTCIDEKEKLAPVYEKLREQFECIFYLDSYSREYWLEVQPKNATKAHAIIALRDSLGCDKVVCFGDGVNDLSMFSAADECYAVANACAELKKISTNVIQSNDEDGVAKWLLENYKGN